MLEKRITDLAGFYRDHGHARLADWLEHQLDEDAADLARRVRAMFRHGVGGLMDPALGEDEAERDRLAEALWQAAVDADG